MKKVFQLMFALFAVIAFSQQAFSWQQDRNPTGIRLSGC